MAQLKDLIVYGPTRTLGKLNASEIDANIINAPVSSVDNTLGPGSNGQVLTSNGTNVYWADKLTASAIYATTTNPSSGTTYGLPFFVGTNSGNKNILTNDGIGYCSREGTTTSIGVGELKLGNNIASGAAGNKKGCFYMYGEGTGYTEVFAENNTNNNIAITFPDSSGTLALNNSMTAATASVAGKTGLVPAPAAGKQASFLRGDGTWVVPTNTTYSAGTGLTLSGTTFNHSNSITAATAKGDDNKTLAWSGTFTIPAVTYDAQGHITGKGTTTMTMPANPNTDTKIRVYRQTTGYNDDYPLLASRTVSSSIGTSGTNSSYSTVYGVMWDNANLVPTLNPSTGLVKVSNLKIADIGTGTTNYARPIWFGRYNTTEGLVAGTPVYNSNFTYNPSTCILKVDSSENSFGEFTATRTNGPTVWMGIGSGNVNHGLYSATLKDWMVYADDKKVHLKGTAATATKLVNAPVVTWTAGKTFGPTLKIKAGEQTSTAEAIPSASNEASGIVTTGSQTFAGDKIFSGIITTKANSYTDSYSGALNMSNSNIYGLNSIYTADLAENSQEGIHFYRTSNIVDTIWMKDGTFYFTPNRTLGTTGTSYKVAYCTADLTTGRVMISDGTNGGIKSSSYTIAKSVPSDAKFTDTTYKDVSKTAAGLCPILPNETTTTKYLRQDGTWQVPPDNNTTYSNMTAATASAAGKAGLVPAPAAGKQASFLRGDGTWVVPTNTTYSAATTSAAGLMSAADKTKLDGIASGANAYSLPNATTTTKGGVKIGSNITVSSGTISLTKTNVTDALTYTPRKVTVSTTDLTAGVSTLTTDEIYLVYE